ncbi:MAG: 16S rRNA (guanine(527)-N(7))-methyltransferase RsmG [bacterium]
MIKDEFVDALRDCCGKLGIECSDEISERFFTFYQLLFDANSRMNLTAITTPRDAATKHFADSMTVSLVANIKAGNKLMDFGTGAGLPGVPLAIMYPQTIFTLNDSTSKKIDFIKSVVAEMGINNIYPLWGRTEDLGRDQRHRGRYDFATARAVAHLAVLVEYALPVLKKGGMLIAMKGCDCEIECKQAEKAIQLLGGKLKEIKKIELPGGGQRTLITIRKVEETPAAYPRNPGHAKKNPLY